MSVKGFTSSIIGSFLGPNKSNKLVIDEKEAYITKCPLQLFQKILLQDPLSSLIEETLYAHHHLHGCSTLTLLSMWYFWSEEFESALKEGCEMHDLITHSQDILEKVISAVSNTYRYTEDMLVHQKQTIPTKKFKEKLNVINKVPITIQYSSRHFSPSLQNTLDNENEIGGDSLKLDEKCFTKVVHSLDHGDNDENVSLVSECWRKQVSVTNCKKFKTDDLLVCPIILPCSNSSVIDGLIVKSNLNPPCNQHVKSSETSRILIINGSITFDYVHLGFSPKVSVRVSKTPSSLLESEKDIWVKKCCKMIMELQVDALLIRDDIDPEIANFCLNHSVLVLPYVSWNILKLLCHCLHCSPCVYILDCDEKCVLKNAVIKEWKPKDAIISDIQYFVIYVQNLEKMAPLQSIVLCHPSSAVLEMMEHQLWHLLLRLNSATQNGKLLPGGGEVEEWCCDFLRKLITLEKSTDKRTRIISAIRNGYKKYLEVISQKKALCVHSASVMYDDISKISSWRSAMSLVLLTLQCDLSVINGVDNLAAEKFPNLVNVL